MSKTVTRLTVILATLVVALTIAVPVAMGADGERFRGRLVQFHGDDFAQRRSVAHGYALETAEGGGYTLKFRDPNLVKLVGRRVEVTGARKGRTLSVTSYRVVADGKGGGGGGVDSTSSMTSTSTSSTTKNVGVILFNFRNDTRQPWTPGHVAGVFFNNANSVANYFAESTYSQWSVGGKVMGWYTIDYDNSGCSYTTWANAARSAASAAGENLNDYTNFVFAFPKASGCSWAGLAYLPGTQSWLNGAMTLRVAAHELMHNFGAHHASTMTCTVGGVRVSLSANASDCTYSEYGDPFSILGAASTRQSHSLHKAQMGWVSTGDRLHVTTTGEYRLGVQQVPSSSPKVLRIPRTGTTNQFFYLEFRQPYGTYFDNFSSSDPAVNGVSIRLGPDYPTRTQSRLLDMTPSTSSFADAPLAVGRTFTDPLSNVSVTTVAVSSTGATVHIGLGQDADTQPPTTPTNLKASSPSPSSIALSWTASTDNVGVAGYRVSRNGTRVATTTSTSWTDSGLAAATGYEYSVVAFDAAGNVSAPATVKATTQSPDTEPPTKPTNLAASVARSGQTTLTWNASTDNVGVAGYRVYRNDVLFATVSGTRVTFKKARGTFSYFVVAYDAAGNTSPPSDAVVATVR